MTTSHLTSQLLLTVWEQEGAKHPSSYQLLPDTEETEIMVLNLRGAPPGQNRTRQECCYVVCPMPMAEVAHPTWHCFPLILAIILDSISSQYRRYPLLIRRDELLTTYVRHCAKLVAYITVIITATLWGLTGEDTGDPRSEDACPRSQQLKSWRTGSTWSTTFLPKSLTQPRHLILVTNAEMPLPSLWGIWQLIYFQDHQDIWKEKTKKSERLSTWIIL